MKTTSFSHARANLAAVIDEVNDNREPLVITRAGARPAVLMSLEDFASYEETRYLLASPANAKVLLESIAALERGERRERPLISPE